MPPQHTAIQKIRHLLRGIPRFTRAASSSDALPHELEREAIPRGMVEVHGTIGGLRVTVCRRATEQIDAPLRLSQAMARKIAERMVRATPKSRDRAIKARIKELLATKIPVSTKLRSQFDERSEAVASVHSELWELIECHGDLLPEPKQVWTQLLNDDLLLATSVEPALALLTRDGDAPDPGLRAKEFQFLTVLRDARGKKLTIAQIVPRAFRQDHERRINTDDRRAMRALVEQERVQTDGRGPGATHRYWVPADA